MIRFGGTGGFDLIPGHASEDHSHAAGVGDSGECESGADETCQSDPVRMDEIAEERSREDEKTRSDADLSFEGDDFLASHDGETGGIPGLGSPFDVNDVPACGGKFFAGLFPARSGTADDVEGFGRFSDAAFLEGFGGDSIEGEVVGEIDVNLLKFDGGADVNEFNVGSGGFQLGELLRGDGGGHEENSFRQ